MFFYKKLSIKISLLMLSSLCAGMDLGKVYRPDNSEGLPLAQNYYKENKFNEGFDVLSFLLQTEKGEYTDQIAEIFSHSPAAIKHFDSRLSDIQSQQWLPGVDHGFLDVLCEIKDMPSYLDTDTLDNLSARYLRSYSQTKNEVYLKQAILYSLWGAKVGDGLSNNICYTRLFHIINGEYSQKPQYQAYYDYLIPLLQTGDHSAQEIFNRMCLKSEGSLKWIEKFLELLEKFKTDENKLEAVRKAMFSFDSWKQERSYQEYIKMWEENPYDAIPGMFALSEKGYSKAEEKIAEIRNSPGYKNPLKAKESDYGAFLKKLEEVEASKYFEYFNIEFLQKYFGKKGKSFSQTDFSANLSKIIFSLYKAADLGNKAAREQVKKLKKLKAYKEAEKSLKAPSLNDPFSQLAFQYYHFEGIQKHLKEASIPHPSPNSNSGESESAHITAPTTLQHSETANDALEGANTMPEATSHPIPASFAVMTTTTTTTIISEGQPTTPENVTQQKKEKVRKTLARKNSVRPSLTPKDPGVKEGGPIREDKGIPASRMRRTQSLMDLSVDPRKETSLHLRRTVSSGNLKSSLKEEKTKEKESPKDKSARFMKLKNFLVKRKSEKKLEISYAKDQTTPNTLEEKFSLQKSSGSKSSRSSESHESTEKPFKKLARRISTPDLRNLSNVKLSEPIIFDTLNELQRRGLITWSMKNNTLTATKTDFPDRCGTHTHNKPGMPWYENKAFTSQFLDFVSSCDAELAGQISAVGKKQENKSEG